MTHMRTTLRAALVDRLLAAGTAAGSRVFDAPYNHRNTFPAICVEQVAESQQLQSVMSGSANAIVERGLQIEIKAEISQIDGYQTALDAICEQIEAAASTLSVAGLKNIQAAGYSQDEVMTDNAPVTIGRQRYVLTYYTTQAAPGAPL